MSAKWTPGPWQFKFHEYGGYDGMTSSIEVTANDDETHVCELDFTHYGQRLNQQPRTADACLLAVVNARLIAAAPELAKACEAAWNCISELPPTQARVEVAHMLCAALARARGES